MNRNKLIVSLCDHSGAWSKPYLDAGYTVFRVDPKHDGNDTTEGTQIYGSGSCVRAPDGAFNLSMTARQLVEKISEWHGSGWTGAEVFDVLATIASGEVYNGLRPHLVLAAPPCTHFSGSGARWWPEKDADGRTAEAVEIVYDCLDVVALLNPKFWALENPVGRISKLVPELNLYPKFMFDPCDFASYADFDRVDAERYTKKTCLWGRLNANTLKSLSQRLEPVMIEKRRKDGSIVRGSWLWANLGGKSERTKALRSVTPAGFSRAFFRAHQ